MKLFKLIYKERAFNYKGKIIRLTDEVNYPEDHYIYLAFKSHFRPVQEDGAGNGPVMLIEDPVADAKVIVEDDKVSTDVTDDTVNLEDLETESDETEHASDLVVDYTTLETKEELLQYIKDNGLDVTVGNTRDVEKIKAKIKDSLEG